MTTISPQSRDLIAVLSDLWPQAFVVYERRRRPLKLGIHQDIEAAAAGAITPEEIKVALRSYTRNVGYLLACKEGAARIGLDGEPAGSVTANEAAHAAQLIAYKRSSKLAADKQESGRRRRRPLLGSNSDEAAPDHQGALALQTTNAAPRRLGLADLRAAAPERRQREAQL